MNAAKTKGVTQFAVAQRPIDGEENGPVSVATGYRNCDCRDRNRCCLSESLLSQIQPRRGVSAHRFRRAEDRPLRRLYSLAVPAQSRRNQYADQPHRSEAHRREVPDHCRPHKSRCGIGVLCSRIANDGRGGNGGPIPGRSLAQSRRHTQFTGRPLRRRLAVRGGDGNHGWPARKARRVRAPRGRPHARQLVAERRAA